MVGFSGGKQSLTPKDLPERARAHSYKGDLDLLFARLDSDGDGEITAKDFKSFDNAKTVN